MARNRNIPVRGGLRDGETVKVAPEHQALGTEIMVGGELYVIARDDAGNPELRPIDEDA